MPQWQLNIQQDAHEFLVGVLDRIEETSIRWKKKSIIILIYKYE